MQTATVHKNIGLMMFIFACALMLAVSLTAHAQGKGNGNGKANKELWEDRKGSDQTKDRTKGKKDKNDRDDRGGVVRRSGGVINGDDDDRINGRDRRGNQSVRFAYKQGYKEGFKDGKRAAKDNRPGDVYNVSFPTNGNRNGWGNSREWRHAYEEGYRRGFRDGYNRYRRDDRRYTDRRILGIPLPY